MGAPGWGGMVVKNAIWGSIFQYQKSPDPTGGNGGETTKLGGVPAAI